MRKDIRHVVVERPRVGGHYAKGNRKLFDWPNKDREPPPNCESMRRRHVRIYGGKQSTDFLSPLRGFLYKNVGRPWDKVYSEICENLKMDSVQQRHVRLHVFDFVNKEIRVRDDGAICRPAHRNFFYSEWVPLSKGDLYVCPRTGLLRRVKHTYKMKSDK